MSEEKHRLSIRSLPEHIKQLSYEEQIELSNMYKGGVFISEPKPMKEILKESDVEDGKIYIFFKGDKFIGHKLSSMAYAFARRPEDKKFNMRVFGPLQTPKLTDVLKQCGLDS